MKQINREAFYQDLNEEQVLRENIRRLIAFVKRKKETNVDQKAKLREIVDKIILQEKTILQEAATPDNDPTPNKTTGINVLEDLLKKIIPILEDDYKLLTTDLEQRNSFRAHIVNAVVQSLAPAQANDQAESDSVQEAVEVSVGDDDEMPEEFIDINKDTEVPEKEVSPEEEFGSGLEGTDETGRNMAYQSFKKIEKAILDSYELLSNADDRELYYDYLLANLKLYFDRFEEELSTSVSEPTNQAYDQAQTDVGEPESDLGTEFA